MRCWPEGMDMRFPVSLVLALVAACSLFADREAAADRRPRVARWIALANGCRPDYGTGGAGCVVQQLFEQGYADTA